MFPGDMALANWGELRSTAFEFGEKSDWGWTAAELVGVGAEGENISAGDTGFMLR